MTRKGKIAVGVSLAVALAAGAGTGALLQHRHWRPLYESWRRSSHAWEAKSQAEAKNRDAAEARSRALVKQIDDIQTEIREKVGDLDEPRFLTWNIPARLAPGGFLVGSVPDTFTFEAQIKSTSPIELRIMNVTDFACWYTRACAYRWVSWGPGRNINAIFNDAEGCASYVAVITGSGRVVPKVWATRNPARHATGVCKDR